jgi:hypothetical protein
MQTFLPVRIAAAAASSRLRRLRGRDRLSQSRHLERSESPFFRKAANGFSSSQPAQRL